MELTQLRYFQVMAKYHNFSQTARAIAISQSALSRSIAKLEQELEVSLFDRQGKETTLTEAGTKFLTHVDRVIRELQMAEQEINQETKKAASIVNLSFLHSLGETLLPLILSRFHAHYPHIVVKLDQQNSDILAQQVSDGKTDICLCSMLSGEHIAWMYLWSEELFLVVPEDHPLAQAGQVCLQDIEDMSFVTLKPAYSLRQQIDQFLDLADSHPRVIFEGDEVHTLVSLVAARLGVSLLPHVPCTEHLGVVFLPVRFPVCKRAVGIAWNTARPLSASAICFQQFVINHFVKNRS